MNVHLVMTWQVFSINYLKWTAGLFLLLFVAACGASASSKSPSSIPAASSPSLPPQETVVIHEAPVAVITPSQDRSPTDTLSGLRDLDLHSSDVEITTESVVSNPPLATPVITAGISTPTLATTQSPIPTPINAVNPLPVLDQPAIIPTRSPPTVPQQDTEANRYAPQSLGEVTPIPTVVPAPIEVLAPPTDAPSSVAAKEVIDRKETSAADGGAHRFVLPSASGGEVSLDEYLERGNVILVFYRAFW